MRRIFELDAPELVSLARTISRWEEDIICAVELGLGQEAVEEAGPVTASAGAGS